MFFRIVVWMFRERRKRKKPQPHDITAVERQEKLSDEIDGKSESSFAKRPITYDLLCMWGLLETLILASVMMFKEQDYKDNFTHGLCATHECKKLVFNALIYKIVCSILLTIGARTEITILMLPWFIFNIAGVFPFLSVIISSFWRFKEVKKFPALNWAFKILFE
ncbi:uncharacterized protein LOC129568172 [Sitodiplosis mosellana]|uniref:uncharacterized protein LOC129568172 n=1 Tax=Sitodiplosis mosellana TaxID=263140 RepID=UPI002444600F|nr:uncharacterized protein LOC129568172 [Sitodiplosis mosellana]